MGERVRAGREHVRSDVGEVRDGLLDVLVEERPAQPGGVRHRRRPAQRHVRPHRRRLGRQRAHAHVVQAPFGLVDQGDPREDRAERTSGVGRDGVRDLGHRECRRQRLRQGEQLAAPGQRPLEPLDEPDPFPLGLVVGLDAAQVDGEPVDGRERAERQPARRRGRGLERHRSLVVHGPPEVDAHRVVEGLGELLPERPAEQVVRLPFEQPGGAVVEVGDRPVGLEDEDAVAHLREGAAGSFPGRPQRGRVRRHPGDPPHTVLAEDDAAAQPDPLGRRVGPLEPELLEDPDPVEGLLPRGGRPAAQGDGLERREDARAILGVHREEQVLDGVRPRTRHAEHVGQDVVDGHRVRAGLDGPAAEAARAQHRHVLLPLRPHVAHLTPHPSRTPTESARPRTALSRDPPAPAPGRRPRGARPR